ncbi:MAG: ABC transporter permease [Candidatus Aureabacteria bacterium]|nr:ABC transporter permease [Candidatus Auribacterota bacterium]
MILEIFSLVMLAQTIRISVPYILAALGGTFSERSGVINIALEGLMLNGAFITVVAAYYTGSPWLGVIAAVLGGILTAAIHAVVSIRYRANQIISGVAINLLAFGLTKFFLKMIFGSSSNSARIAGIGNWTLIPMKTGAQPATGWLNQQAAQAPIFINDVFGNPLVLLTIALVIVSQVVIFRTRFGLRLRAVGEHPEAADTLGINVNRLRYGGVMISGALAGLSGAWLALDAHSFTAGMTGGRGFIALAAMIFGKWTPVGGAAACLLFGFAEALQYALQRSGLALPSQFIAMIPYLVTMIALAGFVGKAYPPASLGKPYEK